MHSHAARSSAPNASPVPQALGSERDGLTVNADPGESKVTAGLGLAVVGVPTGPISLFVGSAPAIPHAVIADGDVYDAAVAYNGSGAAFFANTPIRYAVGEKSGAYFFDPAEGLAAINARLEQDNVVVVLRPGTYVGNITTTGADVLFEQVPPRNVPRCGLQAAAAAAGLRRNRVERHARTLGPVHARGRSRAFD